MTKGLFVLGIRQVGNGQKHLKFVFGSDNSGKRSFEGIFFKGGDFFSKFRSGDRVAVVYNLRSNEWSGNRKIELDIIDLKKDK